MGHFIKMGQFIFVEKKILYVAKYFVRNKKNSWLEKTEEPVSKDQFPEQIRFGQFLMFYFKLFQILISFFSRLIRF